MKWLIYATGTGKITSVFGGYNPDDQFATGEGKVQIDSDDDFDDSTHYVSLATSGAVATARPAHSITADTLAITADGVDEATFSNLPSDCMVTVKPESDAWIESTPSGSTFVFTTDTAGTYAIEFTNFPDLDGEFEVVAS